MFLANGSQTGFVWDCPRVLGCVEGFWEDLGVEFGARIPPKVVKEPY